MSNANGPRSTEPSRYPAWGRLLILLLTPWDPESRSLLSRYISLKTQQYALRLYRQFMLAQLYLLKGILHLRRH